MLDLKSVYHRWCKKNLPFGMLTVRFCSMQGPAQGPVRALQEARPQPLAQPGARRRRPRPRQVRAHAQLDCADNANLSEHPCHVG